MSETKKAKTQSYVVFPRHIVMIEDRARSMGQASASAGLRSILDEWDKNRKSAQAREQTVAAIRQ